MTDQPEEMVGEAGLTHDEVRRILDDTLDGLRERGISSAVLVLHINDGNLDHFRIGYRGGVFNARGLIATAGDWIKGDLTLVTDAEGAP